MKSPLRIYQSSNSRRGFEVNADWNGVMHWKYQSSNSRRGFEGRWDYTVWLACEMYQSSNSRRGLEVEKDVADRQRTRSINPLIRGGESKKKWMSKAVSLNGINPLIRGGDSKCMTWTLENGWNMGYQSSNSRRRGEGIPLDTWKIARQYQSSNSRRGFEERIGELIYYGYWYQSSNSRRGFEVKDFYWTTVVLLGYQSSNSRQGGEGGRILRLRLLEAVSIL